MQAFLGKIPNVEKVRTFGCLMYAKLPDEHNKKLTPRSVQGLFLGPKYARSGSRVLVYLKDKPTTKIVRDFVLVESLTPDVVPQSLENFHILSDEHLTLLRGGAQGTLTTFQTSSLDVSSREVQSSGSIGQGQSGPLDPGQAPNPRDGSLDELEVDDHARVPKKLRWADEVERGQRSSGHEAAQTRSLGEVVGL